MKELKSLADYNARRTREHRERERWRDSGIPNGLACPDCECELADTPPHGMTLMSNPPQKNVHCTNLDCGWKGTRVV